jgi:putative flippase GtrA
VKLPAGNSNVEVSFIGTEALRRASFLSTVSWIVMTACIIGGRQNNGRLPMPGIALGMWRQLAGRIGEDEFKGVLRFAVVGIAVAIFFMLSNALLGKLFSAELAFVLSYPPALALHYGLNKYWTFKDSQRANITQITKYFAMVVITFALQAGIFKVARVAFPELPAWIAAGVANVLQLLVTFTVMRYFIFSPRK